MKNQAKGRPTRRTNRESSAFLQSLNNLANSSITELYRRLPKRERSRIVPIAVSTLRYSALKNESELRNGAARLIVALLPGTFSILEALLKNKRLRRWYEIHFVILAAFDRDDLSEKDQRRVLQLVYDYLSRAKSDAGYAAWKAGYLLADGWRDPETVRMLAKLLVSAKYAAGRKSALHGIEHALRGATPRECDYLTRIVQEAATKDRSTEIRGSARRVMEGNLCRVPLSQRAALARKLLAAARRGEVLHVNNTR